MRRIVNPIRVVSISFRSLSLRGQYFNYHYSTLFLPLSLSLADRMLLDTSKETAVQTPPAPKDAAVAQREQGMPCDWGPLSREIIHGSSAISKLSHSPSRFRWSSLFFFPAFLSILPEKAGRRNRLSRAIDQRRGVVGVAAGYHQPHYYYYDN